MRRDFKINSLIVAGKVFENNTQKCSTVECSVDTTIELPHTVRLSIYYGLHFIEEEDTVSRLRNLLQRCVVAIIQSTIERTRVKIALRTFRMPERCC